MDLDNVAFIFDKSELIFLLRLLKCENIPFPPREDKIDAEAALEHLREDQLISGGQKALAVDQVIAFLLLAMDSAAFCLYASGGGYAALFRAASASIVLRERGERWLIAPFPTFPDARIFMLDSLRGLQSPCILTVRGKDGVETLHFQTTKAAIRAAEELLSAEEEEAKRNGNHDCGNLRSRHKQDL